MGPPKRRPPKILYSEFKRRLDCFEYRWDKVRGSYYLFNPWTGETIFSTNLELLNRSFSMWATPEKIPSLHAQTIQLFPETYASRRWGRRRFNGWTSEASAATHICAVARGFLARTALRRYYRARYHLTVDQFSGYYFYVDSYYPEADSTWYKPRLVFPGDIRELKTEDPDDYLKGQRYSKLDFRFGPMIKVTGLSKYDAGRAEMSAFIIQNPDREIAIRSHNEVDLELTSLNDIVVFMDGSNPTKLEINEYHLMRAVICGNNWPRVVEYMRKYPDNLLIQLYGFHNFAKSTVPMDSSGVVDYVYLHSYYEKKSRY